MFKPFLRATVAAALMSLVTLASPASAQQGQRISITTGGTGGVYYPLGGGMANILSKNVPGLQATAEVTGGSVDNLRLIGAGKSEVAFTMVDAAHEMLEDAGLRAPRGHRLDDAGQVPHRNLLG